MREDARGQLLPAERQFLYQSIRQKRPKNVLEVGTWYGGGSTMQIVKALIENGSDFHGELHTCEPDKNAFEYAKEVFDKEGKWISLFNCTSEYLIDSMIQKKVIPDFIFFDGPEDEDTALTDFKKLDEVVKSGCVFMMHDWDEPSIKAKKIRPYLERLEHWNIETALTSPESVGLVKATKR